MMDDFVRPRGVIDSVWSVMILSRFKIITL
jgi:hypothetical protein